MSKRILLIEQHDNLRLLLGGFLAQNFEITGVRDGLEAMAWLGSGLWPDAIVMGAWLPKISGPQFVQAVRSSGFHGDVPIVVIGDRETPTGDESYFTQLGISDYLGKPFDPLRLRNRLLELTETGSMTLPA